MAHRWHFLIAVAVALVLAVPFVALAQTREDTIIYAVQSDLPNWDPPNSVLRESIIMGYHVFDHLAARDLKTGKVGPSLATSWKALDDTTWEVKLRTGVKFHDGTPFTARDVKASFDRVLDPEKKLTARGNHLKIKSVEVLDDHTVRFKTDGPYPLFAERLTALVMQSEKVMKEKGHEWMQENPIGTGPYKLVKWSKKQEHLIVRNDDYWGPKPAFKHFRLRIIPEQATQIAELLSGGVDVIKAVPPDQMDVITKSGTSRVTTSPILRTAFLQLDQAGRSGDNPFKDKRVRQAANLAADMDAIIKHVLNGLADRTATAVNPMAFGFDGGLKPFKQDLDRARKLMAEAGFANGFDAGDLSPLPPYTALAEAVGGYLQAIGIRTRVRTMERAAFLTSWREKKLKNLLIGATGAAGNAAARLEPFVTKDGIYAYGTMPEIEDLFHRQAKELDRKKREEMLHQIQRAVADRVLVAPLFQQAFLWGVGSRVAESTAGVIEGFPYTGPFEDLKLK